jgi:hypothetical protein
MESGGSYKSNVREGYLYLMEKSKWSTAYGILESQSNVKENVEYIIWRFHDSLQNVSNSPLYTIPLPQNMIRVKSF